MCEVKSFPANTLTSN